MRVEAKRKIEAIIIHLDPSAASHLKEILERVLDEMSIKEPCVDVASQLIHKIRAVKA